MQRRNQAWWAWWIKRIDSWRRVWIFEYTLCHINIVLASIFWHIWGLDNTVNKTKSELSLKVIPHYSSLTSVLGMYLTVCDPQKNTPLLDCVTGKDSEVVVQLPSHVQLFSTPWTAACQASLSPTISQSLSKFMFIASVMWSCPLILWTQESLDSGDSGFRQNNFSVLRGRDWSEWL